MRRVAAGAVGRGEAGRDRQAHVGRGRLADRGAVDEFDHGMHDGLRVHGHVDAVGRHVEQAARLDHLKALVHQRGRIDRDHRAHMPSRVVQGLLRRDIAHPVARPSSERASRRGDDQLADLTVRAGAQGLPDRGMLGIDRIDLIVAGLRVEQQMAAGHHGLLVGQRQL